MARKLEHDLCEEEVKKLLQLEVPKTKIAKRLGVTVDQIKYFVTSRQIQA